MYYTIENNNIESKFEFSIAGYVAFLEYSVEGKIITFIHMEVPFPIKGKGIASTLAKYALEFAKKNHLSIIPNCPFIRSYIKRNKKYLFLVKTGFH